MSTPTPRRYAEACLEAGVALSREPSEAPGRRDSRLFRPKNCRQCLGDGGMAGIGGKKGLCWPCERRELAG